MRITQRGRPTGRVVAYTTDVGGEQQIAVRPAEGGAERVLTAFRDGYLYGPVFSPDGQTLAFSDSAHRLWLTGVDKVGAPRQVAQDKFGEIHGPGLFARRPLAGLQPFRRRPPP